MEDNATKKMQDLIAKMTPEEIEEFGNWYVQHLKDETKKESLKQRDQERLAHPEGTSTDRQLEAEMRRQIKFE